jgi:hypothetical protein
MYSFLWGRKETIGFGGELPRQLTEERRRFQAAINGLFRRLRGGKVEVVGRDFNEF